MTREKLYYQDNRLVTFTATVVECVKDGDRYAIGLDRSAFYPEGGGQPSDLGFLGDVQVLHVAKGDDAPVHYTEKPLETGTDVVGRVDWVRRFDYMQQHTGQHILSAVLMEMGTWATVSVHQGDEYVSIEVDCDSMDDEDLYRVEREANRFIARNISLEIEWTDRDHLDKFPLRRPPKVSGSLRIVTIPGVDCVPCGGVHTSTTGEVGLILYLGQEKIRGRVRTMWKIGERAFRQTRLNHQILAGLGTKYSVPPARLSERLEILDRDLYKKEGDLRQLRADLTGFHIKELKNQIDDKGILTASVNVEDKKFLQNAAQLLLEDEECQLLALVNKQGDALQWIVGAGDKSPFEFDPFRRDVLPLINGKGGGRGPFWQGRGEGDPDEFFCALRKKYD